MEGFKEFINERLITLGNKRPKYNQVVIMAGGAGSGKGFVRNKLLGIEGKVFDVDKLKEESLNSIGIKQKLMNNYNIDISNLNLGKPKDVSTLHDAISALRLDKKVQANFLKSQTSETKDNIIFDVTMKDLQKLSNISRMVQEVGYKKENIHIVWAINDMNTALMQNAKRDRVVPKDILIQTHELVSYTVKSILDSGSVNNYIDGDFWFVFNKKFNDVVIKTADRVINLYGKEASPSYIDNPRTAKKLAKAKNKEFSPSKKLDAFYFKIKEQGKHSMNLGEISDKYMEKIKEYIPNPEVW